MIDKENITAWLDDLSVGYEEFDTQDFEGSFTWAIVVQGMPFKVLVAHPTTEANHLVMELSLTLSDDHQFALSELDELQRNQFMINLRMDLIRTFVGTEFEMDSDRYPDVLSRMTFGYNVFDDPLPRSIFFRRLHRVQSAALLAMMWIQRLVQFGTTG